MSRISSMARLRLIAAIEEDQREKGNLSPTTKARFRMGRRRSKSSSKLLETFSKQNVFFSKFVTVNI